MDFWTILEYLAWILSAIFAIYIVVDLIRNDTTYSNDLLTSSREGDFEADQEHHQVRG
jgi:hypothetical protein